MSITPTPRQIQNVFGVKYEIDFYQRDYKWESPQVETLLDDLMFRFESDYDPAVDASQETVAKYSWYYLNTFVTNECQDGRTYIVDGQQRLTTITLILIKLYHLARVHGQEFLVDWLKQSIYGAHVAGRTFWMGWGPRSDALGTLFSSGAALEPAAVAELDISTRNIHSNYKLIDDYLTASLATEHIARAFIIYFMTRVELVQLHINDSRDVAMVFEVINDRGEPLQPYEVLKGELLGQLDKVEIDSTYYDRWVSSIGPLQDISRKEPDRFLRLLWRSRHTSGRAGYKAFEGDYQRTVFSKQWDDRLQLKKNPEAVKRFLQQDLPWYSALYQQISAQVDEVGTHHYFNVKLNDHDRQHLLVMSAVSVDDPHRDEKVALVARLFDRNVTLMQLTGCYNSNLLTEAIIALNPALRDADCHQIQQVFDEQLVSDLSNVKGMAISDPFQYSLFKNTGYELGSRFLRYFFARLEHYLAQAGLTADSYYHLVRNRGPKHGYHVEHILADNSDSRGKFGHDEDRYLRERNRLGALVLLAGKDNMSSNNEPYASKLRTYSHAPILAASLTRDFYHSNPRFKQFIAEQELGFKALDDFGPPEIEQRHQLYFTLAQRIWGDASFPVPVEA